MVLRAATAAALAVALGCAGRPVAPAAAPDQPQPTLSPVLHLEVETLEGKRVDIGGPGPVRLVELWATWCGPCGPAAERARAALARHPQVVAYAVSVDEDREAVARSVAEAPPPGTALVLPGGPAAARRRGVSQIPTFVAIDNRGRVAGAVAGYSPGLESALDRILRQAEGRVGERD
jgi:hypothetical protein